MIATPSYNGTVPIPFARSLLDTAETLGAAGVPYLWVDLSGCCYTDRARDLLAATFVERTECSHLLFVDADMRWPASTAVRLLHARRPVVGCCYQGRKPPHSWHVTKLEGEVADPYGFIEVERIATGMMLIERAVLEQLGKSAEVYSELIDGTPLEVRRIFPPQAPGLWVSGDYAFCDRARAEGFGVYADLRTQVGHLGERWITGDMERMASTLFEEGKR